MKKTLFTTLLLAALVSSHAQQTYHYEIDLINIEKDKVQVTLFPPTLEEEEIIFVIPSVIPGSYSKKNFAQFIQNFEVLDQDGAKLKYKLIDKSYFIISNANKVKSISYLVNDTWDITKKKQYIFEPGGSNIEAASNVVLNNHAFFGYYEGYKDYAFEIKVTKPANFYASSHLQRTSIDEETDVLYADNYFKLSDNPVLYCEPDTTSFKVSNTTVMISVFNKDKSTTSEEIAVLLQPLAKSLEKFFEGKLPTEEYWFIYYLEEIDNMKKNGGYGALEHHHSSFYYLPETPFKNKFNQMILDVSSHEFLHILTPLNLHSVYISAFDYRQPTMSEHLWLYEGVTEYFSLLVQLQDSLITSDYFIDEISKKMYRSQALPAFSMTQMSKNVLDPPFDDWYESVYTRGALLAFVLDLEILKQSNGKQNLKDVLLSLSAKYGSEKPFKDEDLFNDIVSITDPSIQTFIDLYLIDDLEPDYEEVLKTIGWTYKKDYMQSIYYFGKIALKYNEDKKQFIFQNDSNNAFRVSSGDVLLSVNGIAVTLDNVDELYKKYFTGFLEYEEVTIEVIQLGQQYTRIGKPTMGTKTYKNYIEASNSDQDLYKHWLGIDR